MSAMPWIIVTGIGGNVGQGILRNIRTSGIECRVLGCDVGDFPAGGAWCDAVVKVPFAVDGGYLPLIENLCHSKKAALIIPSTDAEAAVLSEWQELKQPDVRVLASPAATCRLSLDKWQTAQVCRADGLPFAESRLPSQMRGESGKGWIAKPREGRGSRGLIFHPTDPESLGDEFVLQILYEGEEITTAAYVDLSGRLHSHISLRRRLENGMTQRCEVAPEYDKVMGQLCARFAQELHFRGPFNLQCMVTTDGEIWPFEINCRYSGTNSVRSQFGFRDVKWGMQEYLLGTLPAEAPVAYSGAAVRLMMDVVYPGMTLVDAQQRPELGRVF